MARVSDHLLAGTRARQNSVATSGTKAPHIKHRSPWENGNKESFNGKLSDKLPDREISYALAA